MIEVQALPVAEVDYKWPDDELVVRLSDYDALAAECERLRSPTPVCLCGLRTTLNPHPDAGKPEHFLRVGAVYVCIPCLNKANHGRCKEANKLRTERDAALAELAALKGGREAVAFVCEASSTHHGCPEGYGDILSEWLPAGTELYTAPPAQASAWVSVSERLPAETYAYGCHTDDVLCRTRSGKLIIAMLAQTTTGPVWYDQQSQERDVTHWQPLPAAPTPGEGGE